MNCVFCLGASGASLSKEHLLSRPVCDVFRIDRQDPLASVDGNTGAVQRLASLNSFSVRAVCSDCNNGWMSDLENAAADVLNGWVFGNRRLSAGDLHVLRRWMTKTHMVLMAMFGIRRFGDDDVDAIIPNATLGRLVFKDDADQFEDARFAAGVPVRPATLYGFGTPTPVCRGGRPVSNRAATSSYLNLGPVQLWVCVSACPFVDVSFPPRLSVLRPRLAHRQLQTVHGPMDPVSVVVNYSDFDLAAAVTALESIHGT